MTVGRTEIVMRKREGKLGRWSGPSYVSEVSIGNGSVKSVSTDRAPRRFPCSGPILECVSTRTVSAHMCGRSTGT